jgi:hypothetical protein
MGIKNLTQNVLRRMSRADRILMERRELSMNGDTEKADHESFLDWCKMAGVGRIHARMDVPSTIEVGWPDFSCFYEGKTAFFEFKKGDNKLTDEQEKMIGFLRELGFAVYVVYSAGEAIGFARKEFNL